MQPTCRRRCGSS